MIDLPFVGVTFTLFVFKRGNAAIGDFTVAWELKYQQNIWTMFEGAVVPRMAGICARFESNHVTFAVDNGADS
eukprot:1534073-Amphidinium_carterae.1